MENNVSLENIRFKSNTTGVNYTSKRLQNPWPNYELMCLESRACVRKLYKKEGGISF